MATLIMVMLGGAWVPTFVFPAWLRKLTVIVPTRWAMDGLDGMTWRGLGFSWALAPIGVLLLFTLLFGVLAGMRFPWRTDWWGVVFGTVDGRWVDVAGCGLPCPR